MKLTALVLALGLLCPGASAQVREENAEKAPGLLDVNLQGFQSAMNFPGQDAGSKIRQAILALPPTGGVVDARAFTGRVPLSGNLVAGVPPNKPVTILFGTATFVLSAHGSQQILSGNRISLIGAGIANTVFQFTDPSEDVFVVPNSNTVGSQISLTNMTIEPAPGVERFAGNVIRYGGNGGIFQNLRLIDPWQGFFIQNAWRTTFDNIQILTTRAGTLHYGFFLYGYDVDDFFRNIYGDSDYPVSDAFIHTRNWVTGMHYSDVEWQDDKGGVGLRFDCGSSPTVAGGKCTNAPNSRPEITRFDEAFVESGSTQPALLIQGAQDVRFSNSYFASSRSIKIEGESTAVSIDNSFIGNMTEQCLAIATSSAGGPGKTGVSLTNSEINLCSQANGTAPAITLEQGVSNVSIQGNRIGSNTYPQMKSHEAPWGVQLAGDNDSIRIIGNDFTSQLDGRPVQVKPILMQGKPGKDIVVMANIPAEAFSSLLGKQDLINENNAGSRKPSASTVDSFVRYIGSITTAQSEHDSLGSPGVTGMSHCKAEPANATAAAMIASRPGVYTTAVDGSVTVYHSNGPGAVFSIFCSTD